MEEKKRMKRIGKKLHFFSREQGGHKESNQEEGKR
jgi:hypothetical protein